MRFDHIYRNNRGLSMKRDIINETEYLIGEIKKELHKDSMMVAEGSGADAIFIEIQSKLPRVSMGESGKITAAAYPEASIVKVLKELGYFYKKPMGPKLHFFNKETSISLYLNQQTRIITLVP